MPLVTRREAEPILGYAPGSLKELMRQQPGRWPAPASRQDHHPRALLYDLDALRAAIGCDAPGALRGPDGADADGLVTCLSCGRRYRSLGPHLARVHQITAADYRAEHRLPATTALMARSTRAALSGIRRQAQADDPSLLTRMRDAVLPADELARRSAEARAGTDGLPAVRTARRAGALRTLPAAQAARREAMEAKAHAAGYPSMAVAIDATRAMTVRAAAHRIGVGESTVKRWRRWIVEPT
ncbi:MucR family transcriptional regulator [Streptomyces chattanoogensis]|uniref:MucR family transcriptional regulator n=1 Tax=Streptomyces chattanoogensis TaxID=66876 RepID=UPI0036BA1D73